MQRVHIRNLGWLILLLGGYTLLGFCIQNGWINSFHQITLVTIMFNIIYAVGLNLVLGVAGQFSLGHAGFIAIGAYSAAIVMTKYEGGYKGLFLGMLLGAIFALVIALIVGIPTLRLTGDYLAIATLGVSEIIRVLINNLRDITNGPAGISGVPIVTDWRLTYVFLALTTILILNYAYSSVGRATMAINQDQIAAEAMGVKITRYKVTAFALGAMTAAIGGALQASFLGIVTPQDYTFNRSIDVLIIVVFGGIGSFTGTFIAATILGILNLILQDYGQLRMIIYAIALILIMIFKPSGLLGTKEFKFGEWVEKRFQRQGREEI